jgi:hypothetical protein
MPEGVAHHLYRTRMRYHEYLANGWLIAFRHALDRADGRGHRPD